MIGHLEVANMQSSRYMQPCFASAVDCSCKLAASSVCPHHDCNHYQRYPHTLQASLCLQIINEVCEIECMTEHTSVHQSIQVSDCLAHIAYVPHSATSAMQISNHCCCCAASHLTDGVVVHQSLHVLCSYEACLGGFPFQCVYLPFQPAHFLPGPFGICPQLLLFTLTLLLLAFPFILQSRQAKSGDNNVWQGLLTEILSCLNCCC